MKDNSSFQYDTLSLESQRNDEISLLERHDLLTGEPRYIEDEIRNSKFAMIFGAIAGLACLVSLILGWILYNRDRRSITLIHAIAATVGMLIGFAVAAWGAGAGAAIAKGQPPSAGLTFLAFAGSLIFAVYFAGAAIWLTLYKPTHLCRITGWTSSSSEWNRHMPDSWDLSKAWTRDNRIINWLIVLAIIAAAAFALCSYATWTVAYNRFKFASYALYLSCIGLVLFGWLMIYWSEEAFEWHKYAANSRFQLFHSSFLKALGIAGIVVGILAIIVRFLRNRTGFFILGMISLVLFILTIVFAGLLFRNVYQARTDGNPDANCQANLAPIHQNEFAPRWCPSKYLAAGSVCRKSDTTTIWEDGTNTTGTLNPACCKCVKEYYTWPFYILGIYSLVFALCAAIAAASLFYLSDNSDHYGVNKVNDGLDFAFLAIALLILIAFGLYFIFRKPNVIGNSNKSFAAFSDPSITDPNFERVKDSVIAAALKQAPAQDNLFKWDATTNALPKFSTVAPATCVDAATCVIRYAVLAKNAKIITGDLGGALNGGENTRLQFFPDCTNSANGYAYFFGTEAQVQTAVKNLKFDLKDLAANDPKVSIYTD
jgi:MFS family permease